MGAPTPTLQMRKLRHREAHWLAQGHTVSPGLECVPWKTQKSPAFNYIWFLLLPGSSHAPAAYSQTLVPGHLQKLGHPASLEIQREEAQRKVCKAKDWGKMQGLAEGKANHLATSVAKVLAGEKTQLFPLDELLQLNKRRTPPNPVDFGKPDINCQLPSIKYILVQNLVYGRLFFPLCNLGEENKQGNTPVFTANTRPDPHLILAEIILLLLHQVRGARTPQIFLSLLSTTLLCK